MTTAHRPTFDPAKGKSSQSSGTILHSRLLPAHTKLKYRQRGQGGLADKSDILKDEELDEREILRARLMSKESEISDKRGSKLGRSRTYKDLEGSDNDDNDNDNDDDTAGQGFKRQKLLQVNPEDADSSDDDGDGGGAFDDNRVAQNRARRRSNDEESGVESESDQESVESQSEDEDEDEDEDDAEELQRELRKIEQERAERLEREKATIRDQELSQSNPLLQSDSSALTLNQKSRWFDDAIFQNQAKGLPVRPEDEGIGRGFINDALRSDFHRKFMSKYIR